MPAIHRACSRLIASRDDSKPIPGKKDDVTPDRTEVVAAHAWLPEWKTETEESTSLSSLEVILPLTPYLVGALSDNPVTHRAKRLRLFQDVCFLLSYWLPYQDAVVAPCRPRQRYARLELSIQ
jgi:hypothetical protein